MLLSTKIKDKKLFKQNCISENFITRKFELQVFFVDKGSGFGIFPDPDLDPGDPKSMEPTGSPKLVLRIHYLGISLLVANLSSASMCCNVT